MRRKLNPKRIKFISNKKVHLNFNSNVKRGLFENQQQYLYIILDCLFLFVLQQLLHLNTKSLMADPITPLIIDCQINYIGCKPLLGVSLGEKMQPNVSVQICPIQRKLCIITNLCKNITIGYLIQRFFKWRLLSAGRRKLVLLFNNQKSKQRMTLFAELK